MELCVGHSSFSMQSDLLAEDNIPENVHAYQNPILAVILETRIFSNLP